MLGDVDAVGWLGSSIDGCVEGGVWAGELVGWVGWLVTPVCTGMLVGCLVEQLCSGGLTDWFL